MLEQQVDFTDDERDHLCKALCVLFRTCDEDKKEEMKGHRGEATAVILDVSQCGVVTSNHRFTAFIIAARERVMAFVRVQMEQYIP